MDAKLIVVGGDAKTTEIKLKLPVVVGRGRDATLTLPHPLVSRRHCEIFEADGQLVVRDMGSLNGTYVNNERITEAVLPANELLTIGTVTFRAIYESGQSDADAAVMPPTAAPAKISDSAETVRADEAVAMSDTDSDVMEVDFDEDVADVENASDTSLASGNIDTESSSDDEDDHAAFLKNLK